MGRKGWATVVAIGMVVSGVALRAHGQSSGSASLLPPAQLQFSDANGAPLAGGTVKTCVPGQACTTLKTTWADSGMQQPNANPVVLDAAGRATIYGAGNYYEEVRDAYGNLVFSGQTSAVNGAVLSSAPPGTLLGNPGTTAGAVQTVPLLAPLTLGPSGLGFSYQVQVDNGNQLVDGTFNQTVRLTNAPITYNLPLAGSLPNGTDFRVYVNFGGPDTFQPASGDSILGLGTAGVPLSVPTGYIVRMTSSTGGFWIASLSPGPSSFPKYQPGQVLQMRGTSCPAGTLAENGAAVSRKTYAGLFTALGTAWGAGDGSTTFNLPNAGGMFNRGYESGQTVDAGRVFGSSQLDQLQEHEHNFTDNTVVINNASSGGGEQTGAQYGTLPNKTTSIDTTSGTNPARVGSETRPVNITALSCVATGLL